ncbi:hypothetical protein D3C85_1483960 [compost metagenome]
MVLRPIRPLPNTFHNADPAHQFNPNPAIRKTGTAHQTCIILMPRLKLRSRTLGSMSSLIAGAARRKAVDSAKGSIFMNRDERKYLRYPFIQ